MWEVAEVSVNIYSFGKKTLKIAHSLWSHLSTCSWGNHHKLQPSNIPCWCCHCLCLCTLPMKSWQQSSLCKIYSAQGQTKSGIYFSSGICWSTSSLLQKARFATRTPYKNGIVIEEDNERQMYFPRLQKSMDEGRAHVGFYNEAKQIEKLHINILSKTENSHKLLRRYVKFSSLPLLFAQKKDPYGATLFFHLLPPYSCGATRTMTLSH